MLPIQSDSSRRARFDDLFFRHYPRLTEWALQLARGDRWEAEDLVQELYVQLLRSSVDIRQIRRPEDYLFSILRNLQYARFRRAGRNAVDDLSIVDYDSIAGGLQAVDRNKLLFICADLHSVCDFVCERKNSSRTASVLILRFFLGYFPNEVMAVTQSSRVAVDKALQAARREARIALERPGFLSNIDASKRQKATAYDVHDNPSALFRELRKKIAASCTGECFGRAVLKTKYANPEEDFSIEELAHLVSCTTCLDEANAILGLPLLKDRSPDDTLGRDNSAGPGAANGDTPRIVPSKGKRASVGADKRLEQANRRAREIDEHRPQRLLIAVDGDIRASQKVTAELNELHAKLRWDEKPTFVEALSEQGVRLAFILVVEPDMESGLDRRESLELSDGRSLDLTVSFADETPVIRADYRDPLLAHTAGTELQPERHRPVAGLDSHKEASIRGERRPFFRWFQSISELLSAWKLTTAPEMNPTLATALLLGLASGICFVLWVQSGPRISAHAFLQRTESGENARSVLDGPGVIYQKVRISADEQKIDRAIYRDAQGKRRLKQRSLNPKEALVKLKLASVGVNWDEPLSAANFRDWHDHQDILRDSVRRTGEHLLTLTSRPSHDALILQETLTVRDSDFHPVSRTIDLRDAGTIDIAELNFDILPWSAVNNNWFEPLAEASAIHHPQTHPSLTPHLLLPLTEIELDEAELNVRLALNELGADTDERIAVIRQSTGLLVKGIVATRERKEQIDARLIAIPHVQRSILTFDELKNEPAVTTQATATRVVSEDGGVPPLEDYLTHRGWSAEDAQHLSEHLLDASVSINQDSRAITELLEDFDSGKPLSSGAAKALNGLLERRRERLLAAIDAQQGMILQIGAAGVIAESGHPDGGLADLAVQDLNDCKTLLRRDSTSDMAPEILLGKLAAAAKQLEILARRVPLYSSGAHADSASLPGNTQPDDNR